MKKNESRKCRFLKSVMNISSGNYFNIFSLKRMSIMKTENEVKEMIETIEKWIEANDTKIANELLRSHVNVLKWVLE